MRTMVRHPPFNMPSRRMTASAYRLHEGENRH
jgi:hypothetical protein